MLGCLCRKGKNHAHGVGWQFTISIRIHLGIAEPDPNELFGSTKQLVVLVLLVNISPPLGVDLVIGHDSKPFSEWVVRNNFLYFFLFPIPESWILGCNFEK